MSATERELETLRAERTQAQRIIWALVLKLGGKVELSPIDLDYFQDNWELVETDGPEIFGKRFRARKLQTINVT